MRETASTQELDMARTAAAVLCLLEGTDAPIREALRGLASETQLDVIATQLQSGDRSGRASALASHLGRLAVELDGWSLR